MGYDPNARYDRGRDAVVFRFTDSIGNTRMVIVSAEALSDHFHCHENEPSLLACYEVHWQRVHDAAERLAQGEGDIVIASNDL